MAEREHAGDVRWRHHDRKRWLRGVRICYEIAILQPPLIPLRFNRLRIVPLGKFSHRNQSSESAERLQIAKVSRATYLPLPWSRERTEVRDCYTSQIQP